MLTNTIWLYQLPLNFLMATFTETVLPDSVRNAFHSDWDKNSKPSITIKHKDLFVSFSQTFQALSHFTTDA